ncbi:AN1-type zinc finger protein TMC1, partial [Trichoderma lentiforme]
TASHDKSVITSRPPSPLHPFCLHPRFFTIRLSPIMPAKKLRCTAKDCREPAQRIVGDCTFCNGHFCGKHRLLEDHKCSGLEDCKKQSHARNAAQLEAERTQVIRGV